MVYVTPREYRYSSQRLSEESQTVSLGMLILKKDLLFTWMPVLSYVTLLKICELDVKLHKCK